MVSKDFQQTNSNLGRFMVLFDDYIYIGNQVGELSVYYNLENDQGTFDLSEKPVWQMKNNHGPHWQFGRVQIAGGDSKLKNIVLEANAKSLFNGILYLNSYNILIDLLS